MCETNPSSHRHSACGHAPSAPGWGGDEVGAEGEIKTRLHRIPSHETRKRRQSDSLQVGKYPLELSHGPCTRVQSVGTGRCLGAHGAAGEQATAVPAGSPRSHEPREKGEEPTGTCEEEPGWNSLQQESGSQQEGTELHKGHMRRRVYAVWVQTTDTHVTVLADMPQSLGSSGGPAAQRSRQ